MKHFQQVSLIALCAVTLVFIPLLSFAADDDWRDHPSGERFWLMGGAFLPRLDTVVRVDASDGSLGTTIDFESTLGMDKSKSLPVLRGYYRFNKKHRLNFGYMNLQRSGLGASEVDIRFGDVTFPADLPLNSFFDIEVYDLAYGYTVKHNEKVDIQLSVGLSLQNIGIGIEGSVVGVLKEETDFTAPLPTFGVAGDYAFTDKLLLTGRLGIFAIELDLDSSNIGGSVIDANLYLFHKTFEHLGFGIGYSFFNVDVDYEDDSLDVSADYEYRGPVLLMAAYF